MNIMWNNQVVNATKLEGKFTLDTGSHIYTEKDGCYIIDLPNGKIVATEEEVLAEQQRFADEYDWEEGYGFGAEMDTEESEEYIASFKK